jgi:hypothetical protein
MGVVAYSLEWKLLPTVKSTMRYHQRHTCPLVALKNVNHGENLPLIGWGPSLGSSCHNFRPLVLLKQDSVFSLRVLSWEEGLHPIGRS